MNEYKTQIKDRFPKVYSILQHINGRRLYYSKEYIQTRKRLRSNRQINKLPRIAFIVVTPETWNSFVSVYKEAVYRKLQILVLAVPLNEKRVEKKDRRDNCKSYVYLKESGVNVVNAYSSDNKEWFDLESWQPDYVFYTRTYDTEYPVRYRSKNVSQYAEICVIPYGYSIGKGIVFDIAYGKSTSYKSRNAYQSFRTVLQRRNKKGCRKAVFQQRQTVHITYPAGDLLQVSVLVFLQVRALSPCAFKKDCQRSKQGSAHPFHA